MKRHGISEQLMEEQFKKAKDFFKLPDEVKLQVKSDAAGNYK